MPTDSELKKGNLKVENPDVEKSEPHDDTVDSVSMSEDLEGAKDGSKSLTHEFPKNAEEDIGERIDRDFQLGNDFKDELIPLAIEYYFNVIENEFSSEEDNDDED